MIDTNKDYWDCACKQDYIRNKQKEPCCRRCNTCHYYRPDSRKKEVDILLNINDSQTMQYKSEILEMARIACATVPDDLCDQMDISDDFFIEIRDYIHRETDDPSHEVIFNRAKTEETK